MNKKGVMFTIAAVFLVIVILLAFLIQASNISKTAIEESNIRTKTTDSFLDSLINSYLPDALEMTVINYGNNPTELNKKIDEIVIFAQRTGIEFIFTEITQITIEETGTPEIVNAQFTISFDITNKDITYKIIEEIIRVEGIQIT